MFRPIPRALLVLTGLLIFGIAHTTFQAVPIVFSTWNP